MHNNYSIYSTKESVQQMNSCEVVYEGSRFVRRLPMKQTLKLVIYVNTLKGRKQRKKVSLSPNVNYM
jgi:hypothetical protein